MTMKSAVKNFVLRTLTISTIAAVAMSSANAQIILHRARVIVRPVVAAPVVVAPVAVAPVVVAPVAVAPVAPAVVAPVIAAPVVAAPVVAAPVVVPVYVPTCRLVAVPFVNAVTGLTYMVTRRVCN
jgi:hypothetical protein